MQTTEISHLRASYLAAQTQAARKGVKEKSTAEQQIQDAADPMAAMERDMEAGAARNAVPGAPSFVKSGGPAASSAPSGPVVNPDAINIGDDDDDDDE